MAQPKVCQAKDGRIGARPNHDDKEKDVPEDPPGKEEEEEDWSEGSEGPGLPIGV